MPQFTTAQVAIATTPTVLSTFFSHLFAKPRRRSQAKRSLASGGPGGGPENDLSYEEGLRLVRRFIDFSSHHGVEEVQAFTAMQVPTPHWVHRTVVTIPEDIISRAAGILSKHLASYGPDGSTGGGLELVGGEKWWQVRGRELEGEWIEMQKDHLRRKARREADDAEAVRGAVDGRSADDMGPSPTATHATGGSAGLKNGYGWWGGSGDRGIRDGSGQDVREDRVILYIHGGAYFFSSLDTHRYQVQRHARKAGARAFSPAYRLAPQYPFPCALLDALASYLYLLSPPEGTHDPVSPTSIIFMGDSAGAGLCISLLVLIREMGLPMPAGASLISPWVDLTHSMPSISGPETGDFIPGTGFHYKPSATWPPLSGDGISSLSVEGEPQTYNDQVQMYCSNKLLTHPLVSPVNQGSLGGLCPLFIIAGGGELLRDEIIYLAHKAANPQLYSPGSRTLKDFPDQAALVTKYKPTSVHLQVYEGCCHVVPTLSWTSSAKYMYRACANFNIWAYTAAAKGWEMRYNTQHERHQQRHRRSSGEGGAHKPHQHHHGRSRSRDRDGESGGTADSSAHPSRSGSLDTAATGVPKLAKLSMTAPGEDGVSTADTSSASPATTTPTTGFPSANPSYVDLTKPMISSSAAALANDEDMYDEDVQSECSSSTCSSDSEDHAAASGPPREIVSVTGREPLPPSSGHIVSERVSVRGRIRPFEPIGEVPALDPALKEHIGQVHPEGAIKKWLARRAEWDIKYAKDLDKWRKVRAADRERAEREGYLTRELSGEKPPLCALAGWYDREMAREVGRSVDEVKERTSGAVMMWMRMSSKADKEHAGGESIDEIKQTVQEEIELEAEDLAAEADGDAGGEAEKGADADAAYRRRRSSSAATATPGRRGRRRSSAAALGRPRAGTGRGMVPLATSKEGEEGGENGGNGVARP